MKTLHKPGKAIAATALAAGILLGGPAAAMAGDAPAQTGGVTANATFTEAVTLKSGLGGAPLYDMISGTITMGLGALYPAPSLTGVAFPASRPIMSEGKTFRIVGIERCNLPPAAYYISDIAVATSVPRTAETDDTYRAALTANATEVAAHANAHTGIALHYGDAPLPMILPSSDVDDPTYAATTCAPNAALAFKPEGDTSAYPGTDKEFADGIVHKQMTEAANDAIAARSAAHGAAELEAAQTGYSAGGSEAGVVVAVDGEEATGFNAPADVNILVLAAVGFLTLLGISVGFVVAIVKEVRKARVARAESK